LQQISCLELYFETWFEICFIYHSFDDRRSLGVKRILVRASPDFDLGDGWATGVRVRI
jgi:hypothetical protein